MQKIRIRIIRIRRALLYTIHSVVALKWSIVDEYKTIASGEVISYS